MTDITYDFVDMDGVILRTPHVDMPWEFGFGGFEQITKAGWKPWAGLHADVMQDGYIMSEAEAKKLAMTAGMTWTS